MMTRGLVRDSVDRPRAALELNQIKNLEHCLPYFNNPFKDDEIEQSTIVDIAYPIQGRPVVCSFDLIGSWISLCYEDPDMAGVTLWYNAQGMYTLPKCC
ncbi:hypothetical protein M8C21_028134 [Ambrosia artemisiifolia]|uniref:Uncharacterized protein n=1 Tax=Ambrosia artemisiifolia TaxID=4212 RepID=A0AAD5GDF3_AMBAR|nr:hypothetical protein M8C21_028134 [Ambrosia artemisiifolia]